MRRIFVFILAIIVAAGAVVPCCIDDDCMTEQVCHSTDQKEDGKNTCSPFFTCGACTGFVQLTKITELYHPPVQQVIHHERIVPGFIDNYCSSFFQPPRLS